MKLYNKEGLEVYVEKDQVNIFLKGGWFREPPTSKPSEIVPSSKTSETAETSVVKKAEVPVVPEIQTETPEEKPPERKSIKVLKRKIQLKED
jgi:hypothetical protein